MSDYSEKYNAYNAQAKVKHYCRTSDGRVDASDYEVPGELDANEQVYRQPNDSITSPPRSSDLGVVTRVKRKDGGKVAGKEARHHAGRAKRAAGGPPETVVPAVPNTRFQFSNVPNRLGAALDAQYIKKGGAVKKRAEGGRLHKFFGGPAEGVTAGANAPAAPIAPGYGTLGAGQGPNGSYTAAQANAMANQYRSSGQIPAGAWGPGRYSDMTGGKNPQTAYYTPAFSGDPNSLQYKGGNQYYDPQTKGMFVGDPWSFNPVNTHPQPPPGPVGQPAQPPPQHPNPAQPLGMARKDGGRTWIKGAIKHPGALHKELGVPEGKKIPEKKLEKAEHSSNPVERKRANLAETLKGMHKAKGGGVSDQNPNPEVSGTRPTGGRLAKASGGRAKGKTNINIIIAQPHEASAPAAPAPMGAAPPPRPPMPAPMRSEEHTSE